MPHTQQDSTAGQARSKRCHKACDGELLTLASIFHSTRFLALACALTQTQTAHACRKNLLSHTTAMITARRRLRRRHAKAWAQQ